MLEGENKDEENFCPTEVCTETQNSVACMCEYYRI